MRVLIADKLETVAAEGLSAIGLEVMFEPELDAEGLEQRTRACEPAVIVVRSTRVPASVFAAAPGALKLVIRAGSGHDNIDSSAAAERGVAVCNCPGMNAVAVAELTVGHLISLDRRLPAQDAELRAGRWNKKAFSRARGLKGRSLMVVGAGAIGLEVVRRAQAFGMRVGLQSRSLTGSQAAALGVDTVPYAREALLEALPSYDAVTMHVPLTDDSRGMCDGAFFSAMPRGSLFVNTSRGAIVDEDALAEAVRSRGLRAAIDVYRDQPSFKAGVFEPAIRDVVSESGGGVQFSHHVGASTDQAQEAVADEVVRIVRVWRETGAFEHCVNAGLMGSRAG
ncbi:MAG: NAD(P)-dependent oxidoreductase [Planctomycetota bacterium]